MATGFKQGDVVGIDTGDGVGGGAAGVGIALFGLGVVCVVNDINIVTKATEHKVGAGAAEQGDSARQFLPDGTYQPPLVFPRAEAACNPANTRPICWCSPASPS